MAHSNKLSNASALISPFPANPKPRATSLIDLPIELLRHIISYLPESSAGCLAMCNHALLRALGQQYWRYLQADNPEKEAFLLLLQRDLPNWLYHPCCGRIREVCNEYGKPGRRMKDSLRCLSRAGAIDISGVFSIRFHHVHAIMHRYRSLMVSKLREEGRAHVAHVVDLTSITHKHRSRTFHKGYTVDCQPRVLYRNSASQPRLFLALAYDIPIPKTKVSETIAENFIPICPHVDALSEAASIQCRLTQPMEPSCGYCGGLRNCDTCFTDYEITSSFSSSRWPWPWRQQPRGLTLRVRVWKDLGECRDIYSREWFWATRKIYESDPRVSRFRRRLYRCGAGYVKDAYYRKDGEEVSIEGRPAAQVNYWQRRAQRGWRPPR